MGCVLATASAETRSEFFSSSSSTVFLDSLCCFAFSPVGDAGDVPRRRMAVFRQHRKASSGATAEPRQRNDGMTLANDGNP